MSMTDPRAAEGNTDYTTGAPPNDSPQDFPLATLAASAQVMEPEPIDLAAIAGEPKSIDIPPFDPRPNLQALIGTFLSRDSRGKFLTFMADRAGFKMDDILSLDLQFLWLAKSMLDACFSSGMTPEQIRGVILSIPVEPEAPVTEDAEDDAVLDKFAAR